MSSGRAGAAVLAECTYPAVDVGLPDWRELPAAGSSGRFYELFRHLGKGLALLQANQLTQARHALAQAEVLAKASAAVKASVVKVLLETDVDLVMVLFLEWQMDEDVRCVIGVSAFCDLNAHPWF